MNPSSSHMDSFYDEVNTSRGETEVQRGEVQESSCEKRCMINFCRKEEAVSLQAGSQN